MILGVISDTHIPARASHLPEEVRNAFQEVDLILHAGDFVSYQVLEDLQQLAKVEAVAGNMDPPEITQCLPSRREISLGGVTIGLMHGWGGSADLPRRVRACFPADFDCVVFGHSHTPFNSRNGQTLLFNPGSPASSTDRSFGLLTVEDGNIRGEIIHI